MKSKKRHHSTSEDSEESDVSAKTDTSSGSESDSSVSEHRHRKRRKHVDSSDSDSESEDQKRSKKRKHKKKKKKHGKKKRRSGSGDDSDSAEELSSVSEGEISRKKRKQKHKHKHSKRARSFSISPDVEHVESRLHSVVRERRESIEDNPPPRTYYQKDYHRPISGDEYDREREVERFYRGSSKERHREYPERHEYHRDNRYVLYRQEKYDRNKEQNNALTDFTQRQREYYSCYRRQRYETHRPVVEEYHRRPREEFHHKEDPRGYNRHNHFEERGPRRHEYEDTREYSGRRGFMEHERYRDKEYRDTREKYKDEVYPERARVPQRERPGRPDKPVVPVYRERSRSKSPDRYRERDRRPDNREERNPRYREHRGEDRREKPDRSEDKRDDQEKREVKREPRDSKPPERKSRFTDVNESKEYAWGKTETKDGETPQSEKEKPNFGLSGKLTADANTVNGVVIKYTEPDDAKQPKRRWRFYPFKGDKALPILYIHRQSCFVLGRDKKVVDIQLEHPSVSKQHAALQFRATPFLRADGSHGRRVRPYIIDLDSANGTFVNNKKVEPRRYVELLERDVVKFGFSQREYVLLHENSKDDAQDDDHEPTGVVTVDRVKIEKREQEAKTDDGI